MLFEVYFISIMIYNIFVLMIDCLIIFTFLLLSNKVKEENLALITKSLQKNFNTENFLTD